MKYEVVKLRREDIKLPEYTFEVTSTDWWELKKKGKTIASAHVAECIEQYWIGDRKVSREEFDSFLMKEAGIVVEWIYDEDWCNYIASIREAV